MSDQIADGTEGVKHFASPSNAAYLNQIAPKSFKQRGSIGADNGAFSLGSNPFDRIFEILEQILASNNNKRVLKGRQKQQLAEAERRKQEEAAKQAKAAKEAAARAELEKELKAKIEEAAFWKQRAEERQSSDNSQTGTGDQENPNDQHRGPSGDQPNTGDAGPWGQSLTNASPHQRRSQSAHGQAANKDGRHQPSSHERRMLLAHYGSKAAKAEPAANKAKRFQPFRKLRQLTFKPKTP